MKIEIKSNRFSRGMAFVLAYLVALYLLMNALVGCRSGSDHTEVSADKWNPSGMRAGDTITLVYPDQHRVRVTLDSGVEYLAGDSDKLQVRLTTKPTFKFISENGEIAVSEYGYDLNSISAYKAKRDELIPNVHYSMDSTGNIEFININPSGGRDTVPHGKPRKVPESKYRSQPVDKYNQVRTARQSAAPRTATRPDSSMITRRSKPNPARMTAAQKRQYDSFMRTKQDPSRW